MSNRTFINLLNDLIAKKNRSIAPVSNLLGAPGIGIANPTTSEAGLHWIVFNLPNTINSIVPLSPDEIVNQLSSIQIVSSPFIDGQNGLITYNAPQGTTMVSTIINLPETLTFPINVSAPGRQIAVYNNESIIQRGSDNLEVDFTAGAGKTPLNIVTQGPRSTSLAISIPSDITGDIVSFIPPAPSWLNSGTINPSYLDPATQTLGVELLWNNQQSVGGWNVYRVNPKIYGTIQSCSTLSGKYYLQTNFSGTANLPQTGTIGVVNNFYIGTLESSLYNPQDNNSIFTFRSYDQGNSVLSGQLTILSFSNIGSVPKNSDDTVVSFIDHGVTQNTPYSYTIDSYSVVDSLLKSSKAQILSITTPPIPGIGSAVLQEISPGYLNLSLFNIDPQVKYWSAWLRKNNWPTVVSGSSSARVDNTYQKFTDLDISDTTYTFSAGQGYWYGIVLPYDAHNNVGFATICSGQVLGTVGSGGGGGGNITLLIPQMLTIGVDVVTNDTNLSGTYYTSKSAYGVNKLWWTTNIAGERPNTANGAITVTITVLRAWDGAFQTLTTGREIWRDWEDTRSNAGDNSNSKPLYGSYTDLVYPIMAGNNQPNKGFANYWTTLYYNIYVMSGISQIGNYQTQISGYYVFHSDGFIV